MSTTLKIQLAIRATPEQVWHALTDGTVTPAYSDGFSADFDLTPGASYRYTAGGRAVITGTILGVEPGRELRMTFNGSWTPEAAELPESTVTVRLRLPRPGAGSTSIVP